MDNNNNKVNINSLSILNFNSFSSLYRGSKGRSVWFFAHWMLGTAVSLMGVFSIYSGLQAYHEKTSRKIRIWTSLFTAEICFICFFYLFQDKWSYIQKQGVILGNEITRPTTDQVALPREKQKELAMESR